jgi:hypothetical protein
MQSNVDNFTIDRLQNGCEEIIIATLRRVAFFAGLFAMRAWFQTVFHSGKVMSALLARVSCVTATFVRQSDILPGLQMEADAGRSSLSVSREYLYLVP